jgi:hypothetical protein
VFGGVACVLRRSCEMRPDRLWDALVPFLETRDATQFSVFAHGFGFPKNPSLPKPSNDLKPQDSFNRQSVIYGMRVIRPE